MAVKEKYDLLPYEDKIVKKKVSKDEGTEYQNTCCFCGNVIIYMHGEKPEFCPICHRDNYIKPITETRLFLLQKKFFDSNRDTNILSSMYLILIDYAQSLIKSMLPSTFTYHYESVEEKAIDATNLIISYYLEKKNFIIEFSFAGFLKKKIKQVLWNKKLREEESHSSLHSLISNNDNKTLLDITDSLNLQNIFPHLDEYTLKERNKYELLNGLSMIIDKVSQEIEKQYNSYHKIIVLIGIYLFIRSKEKINTFYYFFESKYIKELVDKSMVIIYEFLKEHNISE